MTFHYHAKSNMTATGLSFIKKRIIFLKNQFSGNEFSMHILGKNESITNIIWMWYLFRLIVGEIFHHKSQTKVNSKIFFNRIADMNKPCCILRSISRPLTRDEEWMQMMLDKCYDVMFDCSEMGSIDKPLEWAVTDAQIMHSFSMFTYLCISLPKTIIYAYFLASSQEWLKYRGLRRWLPCLSWQPQNVHCFST